MIGVSHSSLQPRPLAESHGPTVGPFSQDLLASFESALNRVLASDIGMNHGPAERLAREMTGLLACGGPHALSRLALGLRQTGVRPLWNRVLRRDRPAKLTSWVLPYCEGSVLDLLCGDGRVGGCLASKGASVTLAERPDSYRVRRPCGLPFLEFETLSKARTGTKFRTVLLCTVLHHELSAEETLQLASRLCTKRLIIVENCLTPTFTEPIQLLMDLFYCRCLNSFDLPSEGQHRWPEEWSKMLAAHGDLVCYERRAGMPGIPLPHDLFIVDLERVGG
jgi:hypothetical protein